MKNQNRSFPPLNALRAFLAAGRHLNFRVAAEELGVTQGAVAQHVRGLEAELGIRLFDRLPKGLALTDAGRRYHRSIAEAFQTISDATADLKPGANRVTISVTPTFAAKWLIPNLDKFSLDNPGIDLAVLASDRIANFYSDGVDIAIRQGQPPFGASLKSDLLFGSNVVAVCSPDLPGLPDSLEVEGGVELPLLHDTHDLWPGFLENEFGAVPNSVREGMRFNQTSLALDAAIAGQGIALASRAFVERDLQAGRLKLTGSSVIQSDSDFYVLSLRARSDEVHLESTRAWLLAHRELQIRPTETAE